MVAVSGVGARRAAGTPALVVIASVLVRWLTIQNHASTASCFVVPPTHNSVSNKIRGGATVSEARNAVKTLATSTNAEDADHDSAPSVKSLFDEFASFLIAKQSEIIDQIERTEHEHSAPSDSGDETERPRFTRDCWGAFSNDDGNNFETLPSTSGGITRVLQRGNIIEKGACSLTLLQNGTLTVDRAASIRGRQGGDNDNNDSGDVVVIQEGDTYYAAALSMVLHTRSPMVPTFRSDVRIFLVESRDEREKTTKTVAWFGGGSDLTPYYLFDEDVRSFHRELKTLCDTYQQDADGDDSSATRMIDYPTMKQACDEYFYLPARSEHRGVGGMFFDDIPATPTTLKFVKDVASHWMPSWFPIVEKRQSIGYTEKQREWQLLRRGRYLEFNLLYDRGVKFGLANANPRVEGVMVSAPPLIAWEYNHKIEPDSEEDRLMRILKTPIEWV
eukprot:CAMPEP_0197179616 /NCGR_PEP_ID=MMETSP1423-20130617/4500_1 /TAXON_ID=476441 /ORGANISM="Pseudo-nitzschia heimii, Strain UNC1101" /LENGTH=445 /DNA_ID=CAMNT_0042629543 /DNA_START=12 /DNA_END=1349 /DNA_ORIENTATION=+